MLIRLAFNDRSIDETEFLIERADVFGDGTTGSFASVGTAPPTPTGLSGGRIFFEDRPRSEHSYRYRVRAYSLAGLSKPSNTALLGASIGEPFVTSTTTFVSNDRFFTGEPTLVRMERYTDADFGAGSPDPRIDSDTFSGTWAAWLPAELTERYTFYTASADGISLRVTDPADHRVLIDFDNIQAVRDMPASGFQDIAGSADLVQGKLYFVEVKFSENIGDAGYRVGWSSFSTPQEVLPVEMMWPSIPGGPKVLGVLAAGADWSPAFRTRAGSNLGFRASTGPAQLDTLPWTNVNEITLTFNSEVRVDRDDLTVTGVAGGDYGFVDFRRSGIAATWTLDRPIGADRVELLLDADVATGGVVGMNDGGVPLDGEWFDGSTTGTSGNGIPGGDFVFRFNVLPGDVNRDGRVLADDFSAVKRKFFTSTTNPGSGEGAYSIFHDVNGSGSILADDFSAVKSRFFSRLPDVAPAAATELLRSNPVTLSPRYR